MQLGGRRQGRYIEIWWGNLLGNVHFEGIEGAGRIILRSV
jgi:hypothetical protein